MLKVSCVIEYNLLPLSLTDMSSLGQNVMLIKVRGLFARSSVLIRGIHLRVSFGKYDNAPEPNVIKRTFSDLQNISLFGK